MADGLALILFRTDPLLACCLRPLARVLGTLVSVNIGLNFEAIPPPSEVIEGSPLQCRGVLRMKLIELN